MLSKEAIKFRAVRMGVSTGDMPDVDFIWSVQRGEGADECFGQGLTCQNKICCWRKDCKALDFFADLPEPVFVSESNTVGPGRNVGELSKIGKFRDVAARDKVSSFRRLSEIRCFRGRRDPHVEREAAQARTLEPAGGGSEGS